jgi:hypothetical protein
MRKVLVALFVLAAVSVVTAYIWTRATHHRLLDVADVAREEAERIWASEFERPVLFGASVVSSAGEPDESGEEPAEDAPEDTAELSEDLDDDDAATGIPEELDAAYHYRQAETELGLVPAAEREALRALVEEDAALPEPLTLYELTGRYARPLELVEKGLAQPHSRPWDTPLRGFARKQPDPEAHRFLAHLLLARGHAAAEAGRHEDAVADGVRVIAYSQDLARHSGISVGTHCASVQVLAAKIVQQGLASQPLGAGALERTLEMLVTLDEIAPPPTDIVQAERLTAMQRFAQTASSLARPGTLELWTGVFDFESTRRLTDAVETGRTVMDAVFDTLDRPGDEAIEPAGVLEQRLRQSPNPLVRSLLAGLVQFKVASLDATRHLRLAQLAAAVQLYRLAETRFPAAITDLQGRHLRVVPSDPFTGDAFGYGFEEGGKAVLISAGYEGFAPRHELEVEPTVVAAELPVSQPPW